MDIVLILILIALFFLVVLVLVLSMYFIIPFFFGAPYEATKSHTIKTMLKFADFKKGDKVAELGSGNGKIIFNIVKKHPEVAEIHGFEINPFLVLKSRAKAKKLPPSMRKKIFIHWKSFWKEDLGKYDKILFFQFRTIMSKLEKKINKEITKTVKENKKKKIVSNWWQFPILKHKKHKGTVYLYEI